MTEPPALPPPEPSEEPSAPPPRPPREWLPWLTGAGFLILALALIGLWQQTTVSTPGTGQAIEVLARQISTLEEKITRLEQRPSAQAPDLGPLAARVTALERRQGEQVDLGPLETRISALEQRPAPGLAALEARRAALEARQPTEGQLSGRLDAVENAQRSMQADLSRQLSEDEARLAAAAKAISRIAQVQAAKLALDSGRRLGDLPGAPPALQRFASASPPTEAELRLAFPRAAQDALAAARPDTAGKPLLSRLWAKAQDLVTISQGERVLLGDPTAIVLDRAHTALEAGDLAAAVSAADSLQGPPAQAIAGWLAQAHALLDARAALAAWAANA
jgi:hypothetical protein